MFEVTGYWAITGQGIELTYHELLVPSKWEHATQREITFTPLPELKLVTRSGDLRGNEVD